MTPSQRVAFVMVLFSLAGCSSGVAENADTGIDAMADTMPLVDTRPDAAHDPDVTLDAPDAARDVTGGETAAADTPDDDVSSGPAPIIAMHTPMGTGETVGGAVTLLRGHVVFRARVVASAGAAIDHVQFALEGPGAASTSVAAPPYRFEWDSSTVPNGTYTMNIVAVDRAGASATVPVHFTVSNAPPGSAVKDFVTGLIYEHSVGTTPTAPPAAFVAAHPYLSAFGVIDPWSVLQPTPDSAIDFTVLEQLRLVATGAGRQYIFILKSGGNATPDWVQLAGTPPATPAMQLYRPFVPPTGTGASGMEASMVPWDPVVRDYWLDLTSQIAAHYDDDPDFRGIYVAGCTARYPEMIFPSQSQFLDASMLPPNGIHAPFDDPESAFDEIGATWGSVYAQAWLDTVRVLTTQFQQTRVINMLDELNLSGHGYDVFNAVWPALHTGYTGQITVGTANMGNMVDLTNMKYQVLRGGSGMPPVYYEIGPDKVLYSGTTHALYDAIVRCGTPEHCSAALVFASEFNASTAPQADAEARCAACSVWGATGGPSCMGVPVTCPP